MKINAEKFDVLETCTDMEKNLLYRIVRDKSSGKCYLLNCNDDVIKKGTLKDCVDNKERAKESTRKCWGQ